MKKGNVANQREHLILLLANIDSRNKNSDNYELVYPLFLFYVQEQTSFHLAA